MYRISAILAAAGLLLLVGSAFVAPPATVPPPAATPTVDLVAQGRALFVAKGCVSCHRHAAVPDSGPFRGDDVPDLSAPRSDAEFLRRWLTNPAAMKPDTYMPRLTLSNPEIDALVAFLGHG
jgi:mono/diheme cytochrome c family protein